MERTKKHRYHMAAVIGWLDARECEFGQTGFAPLVAKLTATPDYLAMFDEDGMARGRVAYNQYDYGYTIKLNAHAGQRTGEAV